MYHISGVTCQVSGVMCYSLNPKPRFLKVQNIPKAATAKKCFPKNVPYFGIILASRRPKEGQNGQHYRVKYLIFIAYFPLKTTS